MMPTISPTPDIAPQTFPYLSLRSRVHAVLAACEGLSPQVTTWHASTWEEERDGW